MMTSVQCPGCESFLEVGESSAPFCSHDGEQWEVVVVLCDCGETFAVRDGMARPLDLEERMAIALTLAARARLLHPTNKLYRQGVAELAALAVEPNQQN